MGIWNFVTTNFEKICNYSANENFVDCSFNRFWPVLLLKLNILNIFVVVDFFEIVISIRSIIEFVLNLN